MNIIDNHSIKMSLNESENYYLLDQKLFQKFHEFLPVRLNMNFIQKIQDKQLLYSKKYYPITQTELDIIKTQLKNNLNEKQKKEVDENQDKAELQIDENQEKKEEEREETKEEDEKEEEEKEEEEEKQKEPEEKDAQKKQILLSYWKPIKWQCFKTNSKKGRSSD